MIQTKVMPESDGGALTLKRAIITRGEDEELIGDLRAIGHALALRAKKLATSKEDEEARRIRFETALAEGMRMDREEMQEMDRQLMMDILKKLIDEAENERERERTEGWMLA